MFLLNIGSFFFYDAVEEAVGWKDGFLRTQIKKNKWLPAPLTVAALGNRYSERQFGP